jgi:heme-degrading monooxygenase HmoA
MVAAMATATGRLTGMADFARVARDAIQDWLSDYDGFRGVLVLTDEDAGRSRIITLWETAEAEAHARTSRVEMRDKIVATAGMTVEGQLEVYEVPVCEILPAPGG